MKFKLIEDINRGHEDVSSNELLNEELGVRVYLGQDGKKIGGLFIETGKLLKQLWCQDNEYYDDIKLRVLYRGMYNLIFQIFL